jgi:hypothetical protein
MLSECTFLKIKTYRTIIFLLSLYGCEAWLLILREEHRLGLFENRVLREMFRRKEDRVIRDWRKQPNEELHNLFSLSYFVQINSKTKRWRGGGCSSHGKYEKCVQFIVKPDKNISLGKPRRRWKDCIKTYVTEIFVEDLGVIHLAEGTD